MLELKDEYHFY